MTCRDTQDLASTYLDGELPQEICDRIRRHLLACASCRQEIESVRMAVEVIAASHARPAVDEKFIRCALATLQRELDICEKQPESPGQLVLTIERDR